jgi:two-component system, chemotaxis family, protein-glutamate methylesterase/glutaminase
VIAAAQGQAIEPGTVYVAKPDLHLTIDANRRFAYANRRRIHFVRSSANPLFESAARVFGGRTIAVVLSGSGSDGTEGAQGVKKQGGWVIAQDKATAKHWGMPESAVKSGAVDYLLPIHLIGPALEAIVRGAVGNLVETK